MDCDEYVKTSLYDSRIEERILFDSYSLSPTLRILLSETRGVSLSRSLVASERLRRQ